MADESAAVMASTQNIDRAMTELNRAFVRARVSVCVYSCVRALVLVFVSS